EVLKDPEKRAAYDELGANWKAGEQFRPPPDWGSGFEFSGGAGRAGGAGHAGGARRGAGRSGWSGAGAEDGGFAEQDFSEFFSSLFGGGSPFARGGGGAARDHHARVGLELDETHRGATRALELTRPDGNGDGWGGLRPHTVQVASPPGVAA